MNAQGGHGGSGSSANGGRGGDGIVNLTATGGIAISPTSGNILSATGGFGGSGSWMGNGGRGGDATITVNSGGLLTVGNSGYSYVETLRAQGGGGGYAWSESSNGVGGDGGDGKIQVTSAGGITVNAGISARGGQDGFGSSGVGNGGHGLLTLTNNSLVNTVQQTSGQIYADGGEGMIGGNATITIASAGGINTQGYITANGGSAYGTYYGGAGGTGGNASIQLTSTNGTGIQIDGGEVYARGGNGYDYSDAAGGNASVSLTSAGGITVNGYAG